MDPVISRDGTPEIYPFSWCCEPFSALSHLAGAVIFALLGALLLQRGRGDRARLIFLAVYAASCVLLFAMSGLYHTADRGGTARRVFERLDHGAIFVLVAGTFTPTHGLLFQGALRWGPLAFVWIAAVAGITIKTIFFDDLAEWIGLSFYLALGWFGLFSGVLLARRYGFAFVKPLLWGGIAYSAGAVMEFLGWMMILPGVIHPHEIFHVAVLLGAMLHWRFIWQFADGRARR